jgi:hypothetical protein
MARYFNTKGTREGTKNTMLVISERGHKAAVFVFVSSLRCIYFCVLCIGFAPFVVSLFGSGLSRVGKTI